MILLTPGPTAVPENVRVAMSGETLHHRTKEFEKIFGDTRELLKKLFNMPEALMLASTGTGAMEACMLNLTHKKALTVNGGKFGERFGKIAKAFNIPYTELVVPWGESIDVQTVVDAIKNDSEIDAFFVQISESSTGARHPAEEIAKELKKIRPEIMIVCDGITAVGVEPIDTMHIDALITGSQKALMLPPAMAMIGLSDAAVVKIESKPAGFYFNLATELKNQRKNTTAWTAPTTITQGLLKVLTDLFEYGIENKYADVKNLALSTRAALEAIGLKQFPKNPALSMSTYCFDGANNLRKILQNEFKVNIAGGQDALNDKIFRINHMGYVEFYHAAWAVEAVEIAMEKMGVRTFDGSASKNFARSAFLS
jgi:aspartate aminotransferase-like enzyme